MSRALSGVILSLRRHWTWAMSMPIVISDSNLAVGHIETLLGAQLWVRVRGQQRGMAGVPSITKQVAIKLSCKYIVNTF